MDALTNCRRIKCLTCVDDFTKECLTINAAFGISGVLVMRILDNITLFRGYPTIMRIDKARNLPAARTINGPLSKVWNYGLSSQVGQRRTDLLQVLTDALIDKYPFETDYSFLCGTVEHASSGLLKIPMHEKI